MSRFLWDDSDFQSKPTSLNQSRPSSATGKIALPGQSQDKPLTISQVNECITAAIQLHVPKIWVVGEISDLSQPRSGHVYLTLKDDDSQIRAVVWRSQAERLGFKLEDGQSIVCFGRIDVYSPRGSYQIVIEKAEPQGLGALQLAFRQLHQKLEKEGLFADERKKPIPAFPKRIGFVTSPTGAAIHDFLEVSKRRWPSMEVLVIPAKVQGDGAAEDIAYGIAIAHEIRPKLDVLVVGRGGGSMEDLWCFNSELVVRAIAKSTIPVVSAVGHEIDVTLADLAADLRALTPTEAAERIVPNQHEIRDWLVQTQSRVEFAMRKCIDRLREQLDAIRQRPVLVRPEESIQLRMQRIDELNERLQLGINRQIEKQRQAIATLAATMEAVSPIRTLHRGYSLCRKAETSEIVRIASDVQVGDEILTELVDSRIRSTVVSTESASDRIASSRAE